MKKKDTKNKKVKIYIIVGITIGIVLSGTTSYIVAETLINSKDVYYQDNSALGASNVQAAVDGTCTKFNNQLTTLQTTIESNVDKKITTAKTDVLNKAYPVGSIYMSTSATSPATLIGGTWEQLKDRFLLGAGSTYTAGSTGGEATHKLTIAEMPSHKHTLGYILYGVGTGTNWIVDAGKPSAWGADEAVQSTGGDQPHNNMPPYLVVYMWKRTK